MSDLQSYLLLDPMIDDISDVLKIRAEALKLYREGKTFMKFSGEGTEAESEFVAPVERILAETRAFLKAADPMTYGFVVRRSQQIRIS